MCFIVIVDVCALAIESNIYFWPEAGIVGRKGLFFREYTWNFAVKDHRGFVLGLACLSFEMKKTNFILEFEK